MARTVDQSHYLLDVRLNESTIPSREGYPYNIKSFENFESVIFHPKVTFFVGDNGSGKSTLLEALAISLGLNPEGGSKNFNFETRASHSDFHKSLRISRTTKRPKDLYFLRTESFFNVATQVDSLDVVDSYGGTSLHEQSHGESFLSLFLHRFFGNGLYLLDEPEAALSPKALLAFLARLHELVEKSSQFIIVTHSPIIMAYPDSWIYHFSEAGVSRVDYMNTDHYAIYREFFRSPGRYLDMVLNPREESD